MGFGKVYNTTWFGIPIQYGWGGIYYGLSIYFVLKDDNGFLLQESGDKIIL